MRNLDAQQVHSAMEAAGGKAIEAAKALGVSPSTLYTILHKTPELRRRWTRSKENLVDPEAVAINRPIEPVPLNNVHALEIAAKNLKRGFSAIGLTGEAADRAITIQQFATTQVRELMGFMAGSIAKQFVDIDSEIDAINKRLSGMMRKGTEWVPDPRPLSIDEEKVLRSDRVALFDLRIKSFDRASKAQVAMALAKARMQGAEAGKRNGKPGFRPLEKKNTQEPIPIEATRADEAPPQ